ncbi:MAG: nickel-dependent hydrogenase large subunit [Coriobacteriia bacterium]|nr:nickel-dependent hydrogenase large subunit [Coriobacteriia bacterium]
MARAIIDPITRIEGHLRLECEVENGKVVDAWVSGQLYRGMETVLLDRSPEDAFYISQRICGVCPISHSHASAQATENALGITIPEGGRLVRNLLEAAQFLHSHILWFYHLTALDYVSPVNALSANIADTYSLAQAAGTRPADFGAVATRLKAFVDNGQLSIFSNHYWDHPGYVLPPELDLIATAHYLEALEVQAVANEIVAIIAGKFSHPMTSVPGGTAFVPTVEKLDDILYRFIRVKEFVDTAMVPDTLAIAPFIIDTAGYGGGVGNFLSWGVFEKSGLVPEERYLPRGFAKGLAVEDVSPDDVTEYVEHSWYSSKSGLNPKEGETKVKFTGYDENDKYSYGKAVRCKELSTESGPLARMVVAYLHEKGGMDVASGAEGVRTPAALIDSTLEALGVPGKPEILVSLLGRVAARNLEAAYVADLALVWVNELIAALKGGDAKFWQGASKKDGKGVGAWEAPRGSVAHWEGISGGKIDHYQVVAPTTWNIAPRDAGGVRGPMEESLVGSPCVDVEKPLEQLRIAHSFDP